MSRRLPVLRGRHHFAKAWKGRLTGHGRLEMNAGYLYSITDAANPARYHLVTFSQLLNELRKVARIAKPAISPRE